MMVIMNSNLFINRQCKRSNNKKKKKKKKGLIQNLNGLHEWPIWRYKMLRNPELKAKEAKRT